MQINWKEITIKKVYTRGIDKQYNEILFKNSWTDGEDFKINPTNFQLANDFLVKEMAGFSEKEIDDMPIQDYDKILEAILAIKNPK